MVEAVRQGRSLRGAARDAGMSLRTVQRWVERAGDAAPGAVDWSDRTSAPRHHGRRADPATEESVIEVRRRLREESILGEYGAAAIQRELAGSAQGPVPSVRTIGRILERRGVLDARRRPRRQAPPRGWYLPPVAAGDAELDLVDSITDLHIAGGGEIEVLTLVSLHGGLAGVWPGPPLHTADVMAALLGHWRAEGLPGYAQFDNAMVFAGSFGRSDLGRVGRMCLGLGVTPVFVPPRETGFQAAIEGFNGHWQAKLWARFRHPDLAALAARSDAWVAAHRARSAVRIDAAPDRPAVPAGWDPGEPRPPRGRVMYLRRTDDQGRATILRQPFPVDRRWPHRLVRAEVDLEAGVVRFFALRRREPTHQPLLRETPFQAPWPGRNRGVK